MCANESRTFPGAWGELADLLRETYDCLANAGRSGARQQDVVDLSRAARQAVRGAADDVDMAVTIVEQIVLDARSLTGDGSDRGAGGVAEPLRHKPSPGVDIGLERQSVLPSYAMSSTGSTTCTGGHQ